MTRAQAGAGAYLDRRAGTVVPLGRKRRRRPDAPDTIAELPAAG